MTKSITRTSGPTNKNLNARNVGANITQCSFSVEEVGFLFDKEFMTFTNADPYYKPMSPLDSVTRTAGPCGRNATRGEVDASLQG